MGQISLVLLALALAVDSFAASIAKGTNLYRPRIRDALLVGVLFGGVQTLMPLLGWQVGMELRPFIESVDHWLALGILSVIGGKMIYDGLHERKDAHGSNAFTISALILTAIATSVDSLVVGFGFGFMNISVLVALAMIGSVTFITSVGGVFLGRRLSKHVGEYAEIGAGVVLIGIGVKIVQEHTHLFGG